MGLDAFMLKHRWLWGKENFWQYKAAAERALKYQEYDYLDRQWWWPFIRNSKEWRSEYQEIDGKWYSVTRIFQSSE